MKRYAHVFASVLAFLGMMSGLRTSSTDCLIMYRFRSSSATKSEFSSKTPKKQKILITVTMIRPGRRMDTFTHFQGLEVMQNSFTKISERVRKVEFH